MLLFISMKKRVFNIKFLFSIIVIIILFVVLVYVSFLLARNGVLGEKIKNLATSSFGLSGNNLGNQGNNEVAKCNNLIHNDCESGQSVDTQDTREKYKWKCIGIEDDEDSPGGWREPSIDYCEADKKTCNVLAYGGSLKFTQKLGNQINIFNRTLSAGQKTRNPVKIYSGIRTNARVIERLVGSLMQEIKNEVGGKILVAGHSIAAIGIYNIQSLSNADKVILYDPPYAVIPLIHLVYWGGGALFSPNVRAIRQAVNNGIEQSPDIINMTNGYANPNNPKIQRAHENFSRLDIMEWLRSNCVETVK
jgi:hypothetical protein